MTGLTAVMIKSIAQEEKDFQKFEANKEALKVAGALSKQAIDGLCDDDTTAKEFIDYAHEKIVLCDRRK